MQVKYAFLSFRVQLKPESRPKVSFLGFPPVSDRNHFLGLKVNDFPLFSTSCKRLLDASLISVFAVCTMLLRNTDVVTETLHAINYLP